MFENKDIKIVLSEEADKVFNELNVIVNKEKKEGVDSSFHQTLLRSIERVFQSLKINPFTGNQIPRRQHPEYYKDNYDADNLWRIELADR
jgi:hypothetical protein